MYAKISHLVHSAGYEEAASSQHRPQRSRQCGVLERLHLDRRRPLWASSYQKEKQTREENGYSSVLHIWGAIQLERSALLVDCFSDYMSFLIPGSARAFVIGFLQQQLKTR